MAGRCKQPVINNDLPTKPTVSCDRLQSDPIHGPCDYRYEPAAIGEHIPHEFVDAFAREQQQVYLHSGTCVDELSPCGEAYGCGYQDALDEADAPRPGRLNG